MASGDPRHASSRSLVYCILDKSYRRIANYAIKDLTYQLDETLAIETQIRFGIITSPALSNLSSPPICAFNVASIFQDKHHSQHESYMQ